MKARGIDSETLLIMPGNLAPAPVCFTDAGADERAVAIFTPDDGEAMERLRDRIANEPTTWANGPFDWGVLAQHCGMMEAIFHGLDAGNMHDVQSREKLLDIAKGRFRFKEDEDTGEMKAIGYSLDAIAKRRHVGAKVFDQWRLRYGRLRKTPIEKWPEEARTYACMDALITAKVHEAQRLEGERDEHGYLSGSLAVEADAVRGHWALHLMSSWGFMTDPERVADLRRACKLEHARLFPKLIDNGLVREDFSRIIKAVKARVLAAYGELEVPITDTGQERMRGIDKDGERIMPWTKQRAIEHGYIATGKNVCWDTTDPVLHDYARYSQLTNLLNKDVPHLERGTILPIQAGYQPIMETFRTSSTGFNIQNLRREPGVRESFKPRDGCVLVACDFDTAELVSFAQVCYRLFGFSEMREAILRGEDLHVRVASNLLGVDYEEALRRKKAGDVQTNTLRSLAKACYHPDTEVLTRAGWTRIGDVKPGEEVVTATPGPDADVTLKWEVPTAHIKQQNPHGHLIHYKKEGIDIRVTPDHRMLYWNERGHTKTREARDFTGNERRWANAGALQGHIKEDPDVLRLVVATQADGSYAGRQIKFGFSKQRKIDRLIRLLDRLGAEYVIKKHKNGKAEEPTTAITLRAGALVDRVKSWLVDKQLTWRMLDLEIHLRSVLVDESEFWDGSRLKRWKMHQYFSAERRNIDVMQALAATVERKTRARNGRLTIRHKHDTRGENTHREEYAYDGEVVCLTVPSGFLLVRDGGIPLICGNCNFGFLGGMGARRFTGYAANYLRHTDLTVDEGEAARLKHLWTGWWPETKLYFEWVRQQQDDETGLYYAVHPVTGRARGGMFYTACANNTFQELTAFGAKAAAYDVARAQHIEPDSLLYGTKTLAFIHDELILEMPEDELLTKRCRELVRVMCKAYNRYTPDVPVSAEATAMRVWSKEAKARHDASGNIIIWEPT